MISSQELPDRATRLGRVIILFTLAVTGVAFLGAHILAWRWATEPFLGMLLEPTLVLSPLQSSGWARLQLDPPLEQPDRLIAIDAQPVERYSDVSTILKQRTVGDEVWVLVTRQDGDLREELIALTPFPFKDLFLIFIIPYLGGLTYLSIGIWVYWVQGGGRAGQAFTGLCISFALILSGIFDLSTTHRLTVLWCAAVPFAAATAMHLAMVFPWEPRFIQRVQVLRLIPYAPATLLAFRSAFSIYDVSQPWLYIDRWRDSYLFAAVGIFFLLGMLVYRLVKPPSSLVQQQSRIILLGAMLAFLPVVPWLLLNVMGQPVPFSAPLYAPLFAIFPLAIAYAILRYRLMDVDQLLSQGLVYGSLTFIIVVAYVVLTNGLSHFFAIKTSDPTLLSFFVLALALLFNPLRRGAQRWVDRLFLRELVEHPRMLPGFSHKLAQTLDIHLILTEIGQRVDQVLHPEHQWAYLYDEEREGYVGHPIGERPGNHASSSAVLVPKGLLSQWLRVHPELLVEKGLPAKLAAEHAQLQALGAVVYVSLRSHERLSGWLALGPKRSGAPYRRNDLVFLSAVAEKSASAVENARLYTQVRHKLDTVVEGKHQMDNVFSSIVSGVITTDVRDKVTFLNRAAEEILGVQATDVLERPYHCLLPFMGNDLQHVLQFVKRGETSTVAYETRLELPARGETILRVNVSPLKNRRGANTGVTIVVDDLTERRRLEVKARRIRETFERYVSPAVVEKLLAHPEGVRLGGIRQEITSLYADIREFTAFSENTMPEFQIEVLNQHLTLAVGAILAQEGTLDKFVGDGAMAIFNAPVKQLNHTLLAVRAALATQRAVREHHERVREGEQLHFGIGIAVGQAVVGNIGSAVLHNFTAIGDCVNFAARLSSLAGPGQILVSAEVHERTQDQIETRFVGHVQVRGHSQPDPIYEVLGLREGTSSR